MHPSVTDRLPRRAVLTSKAGWIKHQNNVQNSPAMGWISLRGCRTYSVLWDWKQIFWVYSVTGWRTFWFQREMHMFITWDKTSLFRACVKLDPRVLRLFCQRLVTWRDSGTMEWKCARISDAKQQVVTGNSQSEKYVLFDFPRVSPGNQPLTKKPEDSGIEIVPGWRFRLQLLTVTIFHTIKEVFDILKRCRQTVYSQGEGQVSSLCNCIRGFHSQIGSHWWRKLKFKSDLFVFFIRAPDPSKLLESVPDLRLPLVEKVFPFFRKLWNGVNECLVWGLFSL